MIDTAWIYKYLAQSLTSRNLQIVGEADLSKVTIQKMSGRHDYTSEILTKVEDVCFGNDVVYQKTSGAESIKGENHRI